MLRIECITNEKDFEQLNSQWNALLTRSRANTPFLTWEWAISWWQAFKDSKHELCILLFNNDVKLVGIAPLVINNSTMYGILKLRIVEFIGSELANGEYLDFIIEPGFEKEVCTETANFLRYNSKKWDVLGLEPWAKESVSLNYYTCACQQLGLTTYLYQRSICPVLKLENDWDSFTKSLKKSLFKGTEYKKRRLEKRYIVEYGKWDSIVDIEKELPIFFNFHQQKWQSQGESGSFADVRKQKFYSIMATYFLNKKWLQAYYLRANGNSVAFLFGIEYNKSFYYLQVARDLDWNKQSVGLVLLYHTFKKSIERGIGQYDFLRGEEEYKYQWGTTPKQNVRLLVFKPSLLHFIYSLFSWRKASVKLNLELKT